MGKEGIAAPLAEITVVILVFFVLGVQLYRAFPYFAVNYHNILS